MAERTKATALKTVFFGAGSIPPGPIPSGSRDGGSQIPSNSRRDVILPGSFVRAYASRVTRLGALRCTALVLALALFAWSAASGSRAGHLVTPSSPADAAAIGSGPTLLAATSDRPVLSQRTRLGEGQRGLWFMTVGAPTIGASASMVGSTRLSPSVFSAGPVAHGLAGRGPPSSGNA
jgi:hypothetical protein